MRNYISLGSLTQFKSHGLIWRAGWGVGLEPGNLPPLVRPFCMLPKSNNFYLQKSITYHIQKYSIQ